MRSDFGSCRTKSISTEYAEMAAQLQGLQAGEERRGSNTSQAVDCCMETMVEQLFAMGADVPGVLQEIRGPYPFCADARKRKRKKEQ